MYTSIWWYLRVLPVLHRPEVVNIGFKYYIEKHAICQKDYRIRSFLSIWHANGDLCKHLGIDSSTDLHDIFLNAYINRHAHTEYLKMIEVYSRGSGWGRGVWYSLFIKNLAHYSSH